MRPALLIAAVALMLPAHSALAQNEPIQDNSFLLQEAYNQPPGVVQHVFTAERHENGETLFVFGQEWPLAGMLHQIAFAVPMFCPCGEPGSVGIGDVELGYRHQALGMRGGRVHIAPELAVTLPTGSERLGRGGGGVGVGFTLPVSVTVLPAVVAHANVGVALEPHTDGTGARRTRTGWLAGASVVWLALPKLNLLLEGVHERDAGFTLAPAVRGAIELGGVQIVPGLAMPVTFQDGDHDTGWLVYLSVEHAFRGANP